MKIALTILALLASFAGVTYLSVTFNMSPLLYLLTSMVVGGILGFVIR